MKHIYHLTHNLKVAGFKILPTTKYLYKLIICQATILCGYGLLFAFGLLLSVHNLSTALQVQTRLSGKIPHFRETNLLCKTVV